MSFSDLPFISTEYNKHVCGPCCECPSSKKTKINVEEDRRITNWKEWMKERKSIHKKIGDPIARKANQLLMNNDDEVRGIMEERTVMEYTKIATTFDKYRGNPAFWKMPVALHNCREDEPNYYKVMSHKEKNEFAGIEYVKVPDLIKNEKESSYKRGPKWNDSSYLQQRLLECKEIIQKIEPHKPVLEDLVIIGKAIKPIDCLDVQIENDLHEREEQEEIESAKKPQCIFSVNEVSLYTTTNDPKKIRIYEEYDIISNSVKTIPILFHNQSNICLRFHFVEKEIVRVFEEIIPKNADTNIVFFYDKNVQLIQPGEKINFPFWFKAHACGAYTNSLQLVLVPDLWDGQLKLIIEFQMNAVFGDFYEKCIAISQRLDDQVRNAIIKEVLDGLCKKIPPKEAKIAVYTYDKAAIFESINSIYDPMHLRPKFLYNKQIVDELEAFYLSVRLEKHPDIWDYNLESLKVVAKDRDQFDKQIELQSKLESVSKKIYEHKLERAQIEEKALSFWVIKETDKKKKKGKGDKKSKADKKSKGGKKSKGSKSDKSSKKSGKSSKKSGKSSKKSGKGKGPVEIVAVEPVRDPIPQSNLDQLEAIISKLEAPSTRQLEHQRKVAYLYTILCCYIDKICDEAKCLENKMCVNRLDPKMRKNTHIDTERIYDEKLDESDMQSPRLMELCGLSTDLPAPSFLKDIPLEDYEKRYKTIHGLNEPTDKGKKKKKGKESKSSKSKGSKSKGSKKSKTKSKASKKESVKTVVTTPDVVTATENIPTIDDESMPDEDVVIPVDNLEHYNNSMYILFYTNLQMAIDDMLAVFELQPELEIPKPTIKRIVATHEEPLIVDSNLNVQVFDLKRAISDILKQDEVAVDLPTIRSFDVPKPLPRLGSDISMWSILETYRRKTLKIKQKKEGAIYTTSTSAFPVEMCDAETVITPEEVITERLTQTVVSSLADTISQVEAITEDDVVQICDCGDQDIISEIEMSYYNSKTKFEIDSSHSTRSLSCKDFEKPE